MCTECAHIHEFLAHSVTRWQNFFKKNWYSSSTLYDVSASEYDKHKDDISFTIRTLLFHFNEHDVAHESRIVVVVVVYTYFFCLSQNLLLLLFSFFTIFMIGVVWVFLCSSVGLCIFSFKAIFTRSKLETMLHTFATLHGNLKKNI